MLDADAGTSTAEANWISDFGAWPAADVWVKAMEEESILHPGMSLVKTLVGYQSGEVSKIFNDSVKWKSILLLVCLNSNIWDEFLDTTNLEKLPNLIIHLWQFSHLKKTSCEAETARIIFFGTAQPT